MKKIKTIAIPLERWQKRALYGTTALLWMSGAVWLSEPAPVLPLWLKIHGAAAMVFLIVFGTLLIKHVPVGWKQQDQRPSGVSLIAVSSVLILTGWGLYYVGNEGLRGWTSWIHSAIGLLLPVIIFLHVWLANRRQKI